MIGLDEEEPASQDSTNKLHCECREQITGIGLLYWNEED
jgi:hypothetical protein